MKYLSFAATLFLATTATAGELCVNYVSGVEDWGLRCGSGGCDFKSFNPRSRQSLVVAKVSAAPDHVTWQNDFRALTYELEGKLFKLDWKVGAIPVPISKNHLPSPASPQQLGKVWTPNRKKDCNTAEKDAAFQPCTPSVDEPANRTIKVDCMGGCGDASRFFSPVTWVNKETNDTKVLFEDGGDGDCSNGRAPLQISTADNFILIGTELGGEASVADLATGELLLKTDIHSMAAAWGHCPSK